MTFFKEKEGASYPFENIGEINDAAVQWLLPISRLERNVARLRVTRQKFAKRELPSENVGSRVI